MIKVPAPNVALNSSASDFLGRSSTGYRMQGTWNVPVSTPPDQIVDWIVAVAKGRKKKLATVVFNCHGLPGQLLIGTGITFPDLILFEKLRGWVDQIWMVACRAAKGIDGATFCREMAVRAKAHVTGTIDYQYEKSWWGIPDGWIDDWEGIVHRYDPKGNSFGFKASEPLRDRES